MFAYLHYVAFFGHKDLENDTPNMHIEHISMKTLCTLAAVRKSK